MNSYDSAWKKIDQLLQKEGLPKSALAEVDKIYAKAKRENNTAQLIKALVYQLQLGAQAKEEGAVTAIQKMEAEIRNAKSPARQILQSITADMYWQYFQNNRYKFYNRTNTADFNKTDIATWTIDDLHRRIGELFIASLENETILKETNITAYLPVLSTVGNTRNLRPALFDLLAHNALDYFESDERDITKPAYAFTIHENAAFDPAADFMHHTFSTQDSSSLPFQALLIFQKLILFHSNDKTPEAFIDVDLRRLQFVYQKAVMPQKDEVYVMTLKHILAQYGKLPAATRAGYFLANYYYSKYSAEQGEDRDRSDKRYLVTAKQICDEMIAGAPESEGAKACYNLLNNILQKTLQLQTEKVNVPDQAFRSLITYRNIKDCYVRVIKLDKEIKELLKDPYQEGFWNRIAARPALKQWAQTLPATSDYEQHSVEIKVEALPVGEYALLVSVQKDFGTKQNLLTASYFYVSNISYANSGRSYFVLHRQTGKPLANATVQIWTSRYDYTDRKNQLRKAELVTADKNGFFQAKELTKEDRNIRLEVKWQKDFLFMDDYEYVYTRYDGYTKATTKEVYEHENSQVYFFTDRAIYRPGQTVFFKGIAITKNFETRKAQIQPQNRVIVQLKDVNGQVVDTAALITNDYGSVQGSFQLPQQVLTGNFSIVSESYNNSSTSFSVEEYKRPKFFVELETPKQSFRINDSVQLSGTAKAYAGNAIDGATVKYRVFREVRFLYPWLYYRRYVPRTSRMEITSGVLTTDASGKFTIPFEAIPDPASDKSLDPVFNYTVQVDVTDINGETRSTTADVPVGYKSLVLNIETDGKPIAINDFKKLRVSSRNLSNEWQEVQANVAIYPLQVPNRLIRSRYWGEPDQFLYNEAEYVKMFPYDEYKNEADQRSWKKGDLIFSKEFLNKADSGMSTAGTKWQQGLYLVEATAKDKDGGDVKAIAYIQLYDPAAKGLPVPSWEWNSPVKTTVEPGTEAGLLSGSSADDVYIVQEIDKTIEETRPLQAQQQSSQTTYEFFTLNNEKRNFRYPVTESDRGGYGVTQFFVKQNRLYSFSQTIYVPWTNKNLSVKLVTHRDKTEPGSQEKWQVQVQGAKGEKLAAEMLASMYDASLDQFRPQYWSAPSIWPTYYTNNQWTGSNSFATARTYDRNYIEPSYKSIDKQYDQLLSVALGGYYENRRMAAAPMMMKTKKSDGVTREESETGAAAELADGYLQVQQDDLYNLAEVVKVDSVEAKTSETNPSSNIRTNFNETAFFFPDLKTDAEGNISFNFTMPEALTQWKLMALAHTPDLAFGSAQALTVTQKQLMLQPNAPRFVREKDSLAFSAKIVNMGDQLLNGFTKLELLDAATLQPVDHLFNNAVPTKEFSVKAGQSVPVDFLLSIPRGYHSGLLYRISATVQTNDGKSLSDGEENILPVLTNQMLLTEALPLNMKGAGNKKFTFEKLLKSGSSKTIQNYGLTVEYTANPAWYAIQSLPYLTEYPYECAEQTFNRYYANLLAGTIANSAPRIKSIVEKWQAQSTDTKGLVSALQKNEELKSVMLQETPWLVQAKNETEQKKNITLLFDMVRMNNATGSAFTKLKDLQSSNGGFVWFKGGRDDRYITQYILAGIGHLVKLNALKADNMQAWKPVINAALVYADKRLQEEYEQLIKNKANLKENQLSQTAVQYLYMRSFFKEQAISNGTQAAYNYYTQQAKQYWLSQTRYMQGLVALALHRNADKATPVKILTSLKENALQHEELGMYWKDNRWGYYWYQSPIETQALLIEAFAEITNDAKAVNEMKTWLLKQKQTQHWGNTKATAEACYALLLQGSNWLAESPVVKISLGNSSFSSSQSDEAGTGYFKYNVEAADVKPEMGNIQVAVQSTTAAKQTSGSWGAVYWQYFEDLDKITAPEGTTMPLQLKKQLFVETNSDRGPVLTPVTESTVLKVGDKLKVRIELRADRAMEYVHMKDSRAAGTEPVNVLSSYKWQDALGYYEATKDASTNFFFSYLNKGTYVFEYPLFVTHKGNFSAGIATIQCMYAPEFISHSEGVRIEVKQK